MSAFAGGSEQLSEEEKARYDRQIRVWGAEAQTRIQNAKVIMIGLNGVHPEVVKNIVLAGVGVVLLDKRVVTMSDLAYNYFLTSGDVGKVRRRPLRLASKNSTALRLSQWKSAT